jgi:hypothetical protein
MNLKRLRRFLQQEAVLKADSLRIVGEPVPMAKIKHYSEDKNDGQS